MTRIAIRRSPAYKLRRTVSEILELIDAVEHAAAMFLRKGKHAELARAREDFDALRRQVDELADIVANLDQPETGDRVVEAPSDRSEQTPSWTLRQAPGSPKEFSMSDLSDAIKYLENDAQYLKDNLPNLEDPPTADQLQLVEAFIGVIQERLDRLREVTSIAKKQLKAT